MRRGVRKITLPTNVKIKNQSVKKIKKTDRTRTNYGHVINLNNFRQDKDLDSWISDKRIGIVLHIFYHDLIDEIVHKLKRFTFNFDLFIAYPKGSYFEKNIIESKKKLSSFNPTYFVCENRGKDIGGKLTVIDYLIRNDINYDYVLFAHDKKSPQTPKGDQWRKDLYLGVFDNAYRIFNGFSKNTNIKMCGPHVRQGLTGDRIISVNLQNYPYIKTLLKNHFKIACPHSSAFVAGTMFWVDWNFFKDIFSKINIKDILNVLERGNVREPSNSHAMERIFGILITYYNYKIGSI